MNAHVINFIIAATGFGVFNLLCSYTLKKKYTYDIDRKGIYIYYIKINNILYI